MYRVLKKWIINGDPVEKGIAILQDGQDPLLKSLTVRYPNQDPLTLEVQENGEGKAAARAVYFRILQMLAAGVVGEERMKEMEEVLLNSKYAFTKEKHENLEPVNNTGWKGCWSLSEEPYPNLPEIYVRVHLSAPDIAKRLQKIAASLKKTWRASGKKFPELEVLCEVNEWPLNTILFGPPGTGKTYFSRTYAVAIAGKMNMEEVKKLPYEKQANGRRSICAEYEKLVGKDQIRMVTFHQAYGYEEFIQGIRPVMKKKAKAEDKKAEAEDKKAETEDKKAETEDQDTHQELSYEIRSGAFKEFCDTAADHPETRYVFLIDEINRGNIAKIFGELITLIEPSKRRDAEEALSVRLPYDDDDKTLFSVPRNVYLLGTMNTADRSLALLDTALRRRFDFVEMMPDPSLLSGVVVGVVEKGIKREINVETLLKNLNNRLELLIDREHTIGHAFFLPLKQDPSIENLARIMKQKVIPLLQEFFYDDYGLLRQVLGGTIVKKKTDEAFKKLKSKLEKDISRELGDSYFIDDSALKSFAAYQELLGKEPDAHE